MGKSKEPFSDAQIIKLFRFSSLLHIITYVRILLDVIVLITYYIYYYNSKLHGIVIAVLIKKDSFVQVNFIKTYRLEHI